MAVNVTKIGTDLKIAEATETHYFPINDIKKVVIGESVEFYLKNEFIKSFNQSEFTNPTGTAEEIADKISIL